MRKSKVEAAETRKRIVAAAAAEFRKNGIAATGLSDLMKAAGLTHGGFYKHFASRDALITEAVERALAENDATAHITADADDPLAAFADWYVATAHRDDPATGCGVAGLGADVWRVGGAAQDAYRAQVENYLAHLQTLLGGKDPETRRQATVTLSAMVGAVTIARALGPTRRSDELLRDVREAVRERRLLSA
jgi:TetR/AcrR family transcriptional repressor of nem operon